MQKYDLEDEALKWSEMEMSAPKAQRYHDVSKTPLKAIVAPYKPTCEMTVDELILAEETN